MRRTMLLGAVTPIVVLGILACTQAVLLAQAPKAPTPAAIPVPVGESVAPFGSDGSVPGAAVPQAQPSARSDTFEPLDANPVRQRFLELSKKKALLLKERQLKREIEILERQVSELEAWAKAEEAVRLLHEVIEQHPNTKAADSANIAIRVIEERRVPGIIEPTPDPLSIGPRPVQRDPDFVAPHDDSKEVLPIVPQIDKKK